MRGSINRKIPSRLAYLKNNLEHNSTKMFHAVVRRNVK
jgi:hypothetical protein